MNCLDLALALAGDPVPIADQVTWDLIPGERLSNLLRDPHGMPLIPDSAVFLKRIGALPLVTYQAGENVLTAGSRTGRLLILKKGAVVVRSL
jgi:hypothetical protein